MTDITVNAWLGLPEFLVTSENLKWHGLSFDSTQSATNRSNQTAAPIEQVTASLTIRRTGLIQFASESAIDRLYLQGHKGLSTQQLRPLRLEEVMVVNLTQADAYGHSN